MVFLKERVLGNHKLDADGVDIVKRPDVLFQGLGDRSPFVDVAFEVGDGPALHVEHCPRVDSRRDQVLAEQNGPCALGRLEVAHVDVAVFA